MENLMPTMTEAANAVISGTCGYPRFVLMGDEAVKMLEACEKAQIKGPLMEKIKTICNFASAKQRLAGRGAIVEMR